MHQPSRRRLQFGSDGVRVLADTYYAADLSSREEVTANSERPSSRTESNKTTQSHDVEGAATATAAPLPPPSTRRDSEEVPPIASSSSSSALLQQNQAPTLTADVFCRNEVTLTIINGFLQDGKIFSFRSYGGTRTPSQVRQYSNVSLHAERHGDDVILRFYDTTNNYRTMTLLFELSAADMTRVSPSTTEITEGQKQTNELWIDAMDADGHLSAPVTIRMSLPTLYVRDRLSSMVSDGMQSNRKKIQQRVVSSCVSSCSLAQDARASLRTLQQMTGKMLDELRNEFYKCDVDGENTSTVATKSQKHQANDDDGPRSKQGERDRWVEDTIVRRHHLCEAQTELQDIQARRMRRAERVSSYVSTSNNLDTLRSSSSAEYSTSFLPAAPTQLLTPVLSGVKVAGTPRFETSSLSQTPVRTASMEVTSPSQSLQRQTSAKLQEVPRRSDDVLCKHCGRGLESRSEAKSHEKVCAYRSVRCRRCGLEMRAKDFRKHRNTSCQDRNAKRSSTLKRSSSSLSEVSSSSMEEQDDDDVSSVSSAGSLGRGRRSQKNLAEIARNDQFWTDSDQNRSKRVASEKNLSRQSNSIRRDSGLSIGDTPTIRRTKSTLEAVETRCIYCGRRAPASHVQRCAYRPVACGVCGAEVRARDVLEHAASHQQPQLERAGSSRFRPRV